ncbi:MAG: type II toxin-antitoxin system VapC family toxin [Anaerolineales bacterium]|jgi:predicted nucleic acid-binding protein|nr:type II toxin-antitoxin system VapC family toxin [Anaerolineales bacterium]MCC6984931.1 type II toxin-antitoxin system VapC family toxin [Anaerolineales bacterium]
MNIVDSSGWIEYFTERQNAGFFAPPIQNTARLLVPTICVYEVFKRLLVERNEDSALLAVGFMTHGQEVELTRKIAINAAQISRELKLAMADSIILATARLHNAVLWTQDDHFKDLDGVKYIGKK